MLPRDLEQSAPELRAGELPLTRRQTLFWLDHQLYPDTPYHHIVLRLSLRGALDVARFRAAYRATLRGFDQFRLVFGVRDGVPYQRFAQERTGELPLIELSAADEPLETLIQRRASRSFDFAEQLFDAALYRLSAAHHVFYFCQHHIVTDGSSLALFLRDLERHYAGEPTLPHPSYAHYLRFEQAYRDSPRAARDQRYFAERLTSSMPPLTLYGRTRTSRRALVARSRVELGEARSAQFAQLVQDGRIELLDPALSRLVALATLTLAFVARVSGQRTLLLATPLPNRTAEHANIGGLLMEQTFVRVELSEGETFSSLAAQVRRELTGALRHVRHCVSDRGLSYVSLNLLRMPVPRIHGLDVSIDTSPVSTFVPAAQAREGDLRDTFGVHVLGFDEGKPLTIGFDFHADTFNEMQRARARGHFMALFEAMSRDLDTPLAAVDLISDEERQELLQLGRGPEPQQPAPDPMLRFQEVLTARRDYPALRFRGQSTSYGQLFLQVGQLAARLRELGAKPGARVAFCLSRGPSELCCMLASWSVGAAYVPLDPEHPAERLHLILADAQPSLLITERKLLPKLQPGARVERSTRPPASCPLLLLDEERAQLSQREPAHPAPCSDPEQPAYVLFTSGSTGRPKGVVVPRRAIANFLRAMAHTPGLSPHDRLLAVTTSSFDIAALELLLPLYVGATVCIADRDTLLDPHVLRETLERESISVLQATPTSYRLLLQAGFGREPRPRKLLCGGEALSPQLAQALTTHGRELWNMYGPTETTVWSTAARIPHDASAQLPIGRPIDATQVYVLSPFGQLEPRGVAGELCIGGRGVALGYLHNQALSQERFVPDPFTPGQLLYRTGDMARFLPSGELAYVGRLDEQVKVRGFRIELGEIESVLARVRGVREVVVAAVGPRDDPRLAAYYVAQPEYTRRSKPAMPPRVPGARSRRSSVPSAGPGDALVHAMRQQASRRLPGSMQPATYVELSELPRTPNGKLDRKQLPAPDWQAHSQAPSAPVESDLELRLAALFQEVLGSQDVPVDKDFFLLGGDSVRAVQLRRRIREELGSELPLRALFEAPTVRSLAAALHTQDRQPQGPLFVQLRAGRQDKSPLVCVMGVVLYRDLALALASDRAVYGMHVPLALAEGQPVPSVEEIARRYTRLLRQRQPRGPYHLCGLCFGGLVAFEMAHQLLADGQAVGTLAIFDGVLPRGRHYLPSRHARALLDSPRRVLARAQRRLRGLAMRARQVQPVASAGPLELFLQGPEAAEIARRYDLRARPLPLHLTLFRASQRDDAPWYRLDHSLGWGPLVASLDVVDVPGTHLGILQRAHVAAIAEPLSARLNDES